MTSALPDAKVLINGIAAPIVYGSVSQWNVVVPYEIDGAKTASVQVQIGGAVSDTWTLPVAASAPAIFTKDGSGVGLAAVLNQDGTINSPTNPATAGTVMTFYPTGEGQTLPAGVTGAVTGSSGPRPRLPLSVFLGGGTPVVIQYAGAAPGLVSGVVQVNVLVPARFPGLIPLSVKVADATSPPGVTVAVR